MWTKGRRKLIIWLGNQRGAYFISHIGHNSYLKVYIYWFHSHFYRLHCSLLVRIFVTNSWALCNSQVTYDIQWISREILRNFIIFMKLHWECKVPSNFHYISWRFSRSSQISLKIHWGSKLLSNFHDISQRFSRKSKVFLKIHW